LSVSAKQVNPSNCTQGQNKIRTLSLLSLRYKYLIKSHTTTIRITIAMTRKTQQAQPPLVRLFRIARFFWTLCSKKNKHKHQVNVIVTIHATINLSIKLSKDGESSSPSNSKSPKSIHSFISIEIRIHTNQLQTVNRN
jgi:hypothetical protein